MEVGEPLSNNCKSAWFPNPLQTDQVMHVLVGLSHTPHVHTMLHNVFHRVYCGPCIEKLCGAQELEKVS